MECRKISPNMGHFRTIAPKIPSSYSTSQPDIAVSGVSTKPLVMPTQNYTLMKVPGQNGAFSLVALPQVSAMGAPVIQAANITPQENLKLPIPRYQSIRTKRLLDKKTNALNAVKKANFIYDGHCDAIPKLGAKEVEGTSHPTVSTTEDCIPEQRSMVSGVVSVSVADTFKAKSSSLPFIPKCLPKTLTTSNPVKISAEAEKTSNAKENGPLMRSDCTKVVDCANSMAVLSPVVFSSPVHLISSAPEGKLPILPYSKIKKSIISKCKPSVSIAKVNVRPEINKRQPCTKASSDIPVCSLPAAQVSLVNSPCQLSTTPDAGGLSKPNGVPIKRRGRKRKTCSEMLPYQTKMKLIGNKLVVCKDKGKVHVLDMDVKNAVLTKKYRSIMPKPVLEVQSLASLGSCPSVLQSQPMDTLVRNKFVQIRSDPWKQGDGWSGKQSLEFKTLSSLSKACHSCPVCDRSFQFKHHLQDHLNTHTNRRPYHCRLCRKAYVHSGSLNTHMKHHHGESRLKKLMCCEFCAKVFGHIRVYFGHLKEVHRVIISTETSAKRLERKNTIKVKEEVVSVEMECSASNEEDPSLGHADEIKLQIKCGRCELITPSFSDMKLHLYCEHGDQFQDRLNDGILASRQGHQEDVVKQATHYWKLLGERKNIFKCSGCEEEFLSSTKLRKHVCFSQAENTVFENEPTELLEDQRQDDHSHSVSRMEVEFRYGNRLNCLLCRQAFEAKDDLLTHWQQHHNCEDPSLLWTVFSLLPKIERNT
ncbi:zinc finger protein 438 [Pelodytes ibericus]